MPRSSVMLVSASCYAAFLAAFLYLIGFVGAFDPLPTHVDKGYYAPSSVSLVIDSC